MYGGRISSILLNIPGDETGADDHARRLPDGGAGHAANALALSASRPSWGRHWRYRLLAVRTDAAPVAIHFGPRFTFASSTSPAFATTAARGRNQAQTAPFGDSWAYSLPQIGHTDAIPRVRLNKARKLPLATGSSPSWRLVGCLAISEIRCRWKKLPRTAPKANPCEKLAAAMGVIWKTRTHAAGSARGFVARRALPAPAPRGVVMHKSWKNRPRRNKQPFGKGDPRGPRPKGRQQRPNAAAR